MFSFKNALKKSGVNERVDFLFLFIVFLAFLAVARLAYLQIFSHKDLSFQAESQRRFSSVLEAERGRVFMVDRNGSAVELATNGSEYSVFAVPKDILNKEEFAKKVSESLGMDYEVLFKRISKENDPYEPVRSVVKEDKKAELEAFGLKGLGFKEKKGRIYPNGNLGSHVSGFLSVKDAKGVGQYGIEEFYNDALSGRQGFIYGEKDSLGSNIIDEDQRSYTAINGDHLFLSVDPNVQFKIEDELKKVIEKWSAEAGSVIVMEPSSGRILGMANYPDFDPNEYALSKEISVFANGSVSGQYEPGSIFKPITISVGIDTNAITPDTKYEDKGFLSVSGYTIKNYDGKVHGENTMTQVLEKSLNTGTVFVVEKIQKDIFLNYLKKFGFGERTGIDLPGEAKGDIRNLDAKRDINFDTASFGQGIAATPLQMIAAISAIANGGTLVRPHMVDEIIRSNGSKKYIEKDEVRKVISEDSAKKVQKMLVSVVENGFDKAKIPGYFVAGKTGTAQIPNTNGKGYSDDTIHSFVGFAPAYNAKFIVLIKLDKPQGVRFASVSLTSTFREIMNYLLNYYEIKPDFQ
ncbi:penicillin-binding protein 2 [Candidatus Azambacteria bacterium]|nr:penicillin-binding protein 2 [Candidatus Azambacteria bacterium]